MENKKHCSRRSFCSGIGKGLVAAGVVQVMGLRKASAVPLDSPIVLDLTQPANSALTAVGGSMYVPHPQDFNPLIVVRLSATGAAAFSSTCTHQGCQVGLPSGGTIICPCHGSMYDNLGRVTGGPALENLEYFQATVQVQSNTITISNPGASVERASRPADGAPFTLHQTTGAVVVSANAPLPGWSAEVVRADGRVVGMMIPEGPRSLKWNCSGAPAGTYFITVRSLGRRDAVKVTIR